MPKNVDDIIHTPPIDRRSIRNIPIPEKRRKTDFVDSIAPVSRFNTHQEATDTYVPKRSTDIIPPHTRPHEIHQRRATDDISTASIHIPIHKKIIEEPTRVTIPEKRSSDRRVGNDRRGSKRNIIIGTLLVLGALIITLFSLSSGATLTYTPKSTSLTFNKDSYTAFKTGGSGQLLFSVIKLSGDKGQVATAGGEENVSLKASGKAVVYNKASTDPQRLIKNTRFETPDGKIYRIQNDITIPGKSGAEPGSLEVILYADQPGAEYNIALSDFTIPGLKGDPRFTTIYARSKTPMTGGFIGISKKVSDVDIAKAKTDIESGLKSELLAEAKAQVPEDFILYPNLIKLTYGDLPQTPSTGDKVTINEHAEFYGVMFKRSDLMTYIATKKISDQTLLPINIPDLELLDAQFMSPTSEDLLKAEQVSIELTGLATANSIISESSLKSDLTDQSKNDLSRILQKYPNILTANGVVRPFWKSTFPRDTSKITLVESLLK